MIALLLLQATLPPLDALPQQALPVRGCAAYLWSTDRRFVAVAQGDAATLRVSIDGKVVDLPRTQAQGAVDFGLVAVTGYAAGAVRATLDITILRRADLSAGAAVPAGTLTIERDGADSAVVPVAGLIGCAER